MNTGRYKSIVAADATNTEVGYLKAFLSLVDDFDEMSEPVLSSTPVIGEAYTIGTSHTWLTGKDPIELYVEKDTLEVTGETGGAKGSQRMNYAPKIFIKGDGPKILEVVNNLLNERLILFVQDGCQNAKYVQFGCECNYGEVAKGTFQSGTMKGTNAKGYELTLDVACKYFYNGSIPVR